MNNKLAIFILLFIFSLFASCDQRPNNVLGRQEMENLIVEIHILEGSLRSKGYYYGADNERASYYDGLFHKYNISRVDYDSSLVWYTRHPKQFQRIYNNVVVRLDTLNNKVKDGRIVGIHQIDEIPLWNKNESYIFTSDSTRSNLFFEIKDTYLLPQDFYELSFYHRLYPSDLSLHTHVVMYINYEGGLVDSIYAKTYNDSVLRKYSLKLKARYDKEIKSISGYLLGNDSVKGNMGAVFDSIQLVRIYNLNKQDSIYKAIYDKPNPIQKESIKTILRDDLKQE